MMNIVSAKFLKSVAHVSQLPQNRLPEVAFAGRSNVGKSSLINCLLNQRRIAKTSSTPGKTRLLNFFTINERFYFVDLPGYGFARVPPAEKERWKKLIEQYFQTSNPLKGVVIITDVRHPLSELDIEMIQWVTHLQIPLIVIGNKADKLSANKLRSQLAHNQQQLQAIGCPVSILPFSAVTRSGKKQLLNLINQLIQD